MSECRHTARRFALIAGYLLLAVTGCTPELERSFAECISAIASDSFQQFVRFGADLVRLLSAAFLF